MKCLWHISLLIWLFRCSVIITPPLLPLYAASGSLVQNSRSPSHWFAAKWSGSFLLYRTYHDSDPNINTLNFIFTILWFIWKARNNLRLRGKKSSNPMEVIHQANAMLQQLNKEPSQHTQGLQISNSLQVQTNHTGALTATHQAAANSTRCARQLSFSSN